MPAGSLSFKSRESLQALFCPQSVAVIGASTAPEKLGYQIFKNILDAGFPGTVYPINPKATEILGRRCYPSIDAIPDQVDLATIIIPAPFVADTIRQCAKRGTKGAIVISGGFSETGPEGEALQGQMLQAAQEAKVAVIGPNCQGVKVASKFPEAVRQCQKPLVILKAGWTPKGRKAAESHTRSLAGRDEVYEGVFRQLGTHWADDLEGL